MSCVTDGHPLPDLEISEIDQLTIAPGGLEDENFIVYLVYHISSVYAVCVCGCECVCVCLYA